MEKRVIVFLIVSLAVIIGYDFLLKEMGLVPPPEPTQETATADRSVTIEKAPAPAGVPAKSATPSGTSAVESSVPAASVQSGMTTPSEEQTVEVDTDLFRAKFSNRGAVLKSWELKRYTVSVENGKQPVQLVYSGGRFKGPLSLVTNDQAVTNDLGNALYHVTQDVPRLDSAHPVGHVTFRYHDAQRNLDVEKEFTFHFESYVVDIAVRTQGLTAPVDVTLGTNFGIVEWGEGFIGLMGSASLVDDKVLKETPEGEAERKGDVKWSAIQDKYFLSVLMPKKASAALAKKEGDKLVSAGVRFVPPANGAALAMQLYAGPKEYDTLKTLNVGLEDTIDFGWFVFGSWGLVKAVAKPIFYVLRFLYEFTHNYGMTIILLTLAIKMMFVPLQYKSYKSMKQMQVIQPKVLAVQNKFKDDRERLNKELIKLYKDHKVNPVGGCLPMVLQMPVFVALFNILYMTIDLRQAPFMLWIKDLSVQDPYYVLPIIMGATMVIQQKITPTTMDPTQAKIMLFLPVFMTFLFVNFPAGLVLYWLTNNVLTITQQVVTDRLFAKKWHAPAVEGGGEADDESKEQKANGKRRSGQTE
ncbi:MAG: Inner membrane protein translocase and chaperone YidC, long form [Nitrospira sp.]|jgi:YidC/Oxa1 family membrane protein insertase|nr:MAG: Inner membrane protein translocase and chaperone YidC, long form [Nitrospira sp.]